MANLSSGMNDRFAVRLKKWLEKTYTTENFVAYIYAN